jgi:hypothetical protein
MFRIWGLSILECCQEYRGKTLLIAEDHFSQMPGKILGFQGTFFENDDVSACDLSKSSIQLGM